ncbi:AAA family ATPase [Eubacterium sp. MSJ-33]|uniref:AAA family ATPase n=1 Tax=Eubacterium sp. MSJ-33 TaxID=2841528 RepID=UPI001C7875DF|nr:AAA family ATPase [Eubacterium sp. MSJ-33]QWT52142.1 AAA family ATPase [Eubacterium sp. MSJ-33]
MPEARFAAGKTLILLDEVQECPEAMTSLKFWTQDHRYDVIATGSGLGMNYRQESSYPHVSDRYRIAYGWI